MKKHKVKYLVIGGIAAVLYGVPRATFDLDILIEATPKNVQKLLDAFIDAGLYTASITSVDAVLAAEVTVFKDLVRIGQKGTGKFFLPPPCLRLTKSNNPCA